MVKRKATVLILALAASVVGIAVGGAPGGSQVIVPEGAVDIEEILGAALTDPLEGHCLAFTSDADGMVPELERDPVTGTFILRENGDPGGAIVPKPNGLAVVTAPNPSDLQLTTPGTPLVAVLEWSGADDMTPPAAGESDITIEVLAGPDGPVAPTTVTGVRQSGTAQIPISYMPAFPAVAGAEPTPIYTWIADVSAMFSTAGAYTVQVTGYDAERLPESTVPGSWGATLTIVYDDPDPACTNHDEAGLLWKVGADNYFGGENPDEEAWMGDPFNLPAGEPGAGHLSEVFLFDLAEADVVPITDIEIDVQFSSGGSDLTRWQSYDLAGTQCRTSALWYTVSGPGITMPTPGSGDHFVTIKPGDFAGDPFAGTPQAGPVEWASPVVKAEYGAREILRGPFIVSPPCSAGPDVAPVATDPADNRFYDGDDGLRYEPGHRCVDPAGVLDGACADFGVVPGSVEPAGGGWRDPEWSLVRFRVTVPAGTEWFAFQLESPTDQRAKFNISPESGGWSGQVMVLLPAQVTGELQVVKSLSGVAAGHVPGTTFGATITCDDGTDTTLDLTPGTPQTVDGLTIGTVCTVTETSVPEPAPGHTYEPPTVTPASITIANETETFLVTIDNPIRAAGGITIEKRVEGDVGAYIPGTEFGFSLDCDGSEHDRTFSIVDGARFTVEDIPAGTVCNVVETSVPEAANGFRWGPAFTGTFTIETGTIPLEVIASNSGIGVEATVLEVQKVTSGATDGVLAGSLFGIRLDCSDDAFDADLELEAGEVQRILDIPLDTSCTVTETSVPDPVAGYRYGEPAYEPAQTVLLDQATIDAAGGGAIRIVVDNPLEPPPTTTSSTTTITVTGAESRTTAYGAVGLIVLGAIALVVSGLMKRIRIDH